MNGSNVNLADQLEAMTRQVEALLVFDTATTSLLEGDADLAPADQPPQPAPGRITANQGMQTNEDRAGM